MSSQKTVTGGLLLSIVFASSLAKADEPARPSGAQPAMAAAAPANNAGTERQRPRLEVDFWTAATIGVVGAAAGGYFGYAAYQSVVAANAAADRTTYDAAVSDAEKRSRLANISFGAAAVGAVAAASIFWQVRSEGSSAVVVAPAASGLQVSGRF